MGLEELAGLVQSALDAEDLSAFAELLDPDVTWGPTGSGCSNRRQVVNWYNRARAEGMSGHVTEVTTGRDCLLVGMKVTRPGGAAPGEEAPPDPAPGDQASSTQGSSGEEAQRWQVLRVRHGLVVDIQGYEDRAEAAALAGL